MLLSNDIIVYFYSIVRKEMSNINGMLTKIRFI
jgi:hypothetical protein